jgi:hypothetical protein
MVYFNPLLACLMMLEMRQDVICVAKTMREFMEI